MQNNDYKEQKYKPTYAAFTSICLINFHMAMKPQS